jgi:hypothetical protein
VKPGIGIIYAWNAHEYVYSRRLDMDSSAVAETVTNFRDSGFRAASKEVRQ